MHLSPYATSRCFPYTSDRKYAVVSVARRGEAGHVQEVELDWRRRQLNVLGMSLALSSLCKVLPSHGLEENGDVTYTGSTYTIRYPQAWDVSSKAGADVFLKSTGVTVGITILPVRISRVEEYGTVEKVADKIVQTERAKDGTLRAEMLQIGSVELGDGTTAYDYEYEVQNTRATKRILSRVCIRDKQLFVVNGTISCGKMDACDMARISDLLDRTRASVMSFALR